MNKRDNFSSKQWKYLATLSLLNISSSISLNICTNVINDTPNYFVFCFITHLALAQIDPLCTFCENGCICYMLNSQQTHVQPMFKTDVKSHLCVLNNAISHSDHGNKCYCYFHDYHSYHYHHHTIATAHLKWRITWSFNFQCVESTLVLKHVDDFTAETSCGWHFLQIP